MPDLHEVLTEAVPPVDSRFDDADIRARVADMQRRQRRTAIGSMVAVVLLVGALVIPALLLHDDAPAVLTEPDGPVELVPLSQWPYSVDFAGVEVAVEIVDAMDEAPQARVAVGPGDAALNTAPHEKVDSQAWQFDDDEDVRSQPADHVEGDVADQHVYRSRLWFGCGTGQLVHMVERGRAADAPVFEVVGPSDRWLPPEALAEAARQLTAEMGCSAEAPPGTPAEDMPGRLWLGPLAAAIDEAGIATCCYDGYLPGGVNTWVVEVSDGDYMSLSISQFEALEPRSEDHLPLPLELIDLAGGQAVNEAQPNDPADVVRFTCEDVSILAHPTSGEATSVGRFAERVSCTPAVPPGYMATLALGEVLRDLGVEVVDNVPDQAIGIVSAIHEGSRLEIRSGGSSQVGLSPETATDPVRGWFPLDPATDGGPGAMAQCAITHVIRATDDAGADVALALAEQIVAHPGCDLEAAFGPSPDQPEPDVSAPTEQPGPPEAPAPQDPLIPVRSPPPADPEAVAQQVVEAMAAAGLDVSRLGRGSASFSFQPSVPGTSRHGVSVTADDLSRFAISYSSELIVVDDRLGEVAHLGAGSIGFTCHGVDFSVGGGDSDPATPTAVEVPAIVQLVEVAGCSPSPPPITGVAAGDPDLPWLSIREVRLNVAFAALGVERCCGEPSNGLANAHSGMVWKGHEMRIDALPLGSQPPTLYSPTPTDLAGGQAEVGDVDGWRHLAFGCGDTSYHVSTTAPLDVAVEATEALVGQLGCTPSTG